MRVAPLYLAIWAFAGAVQARAADGAAAEVSVGLAKIDITPDLPILLSGYEERASEADRVGKHLYARAIAIGTDAQQPVVLITVELIGISADLSDSVSASLARDQGVDRAHLAVSATHIHTGPAIDGVVPYLFPRDLSPAEAAHIHRYTEALRLKLVEAAVAALGHREPARLAWGQGKANFAVQRRMIVNGKWVDFGADPAGKSDHAMPMLEVTDLKGRIRAVLVGYACHNTTLGPSDNLVHSDWAGAASAEIEGGHPGAMALVALGCAGDTDPFPRESMAYVGPHGHEIASEVERLLRTPLIPLGRVTAATFRRIELNEDHVVTRAELQDMALSNDKGSTIGYAAAKWLRQDADGKLPRGVPYYVQCWSFGRDLAMVFLSGEVVADYSLRLRRELDASRLWVNAYSNSVPCYIPADYMFSEGGYEVDFSRYYYGIPARLATHTEDQIIGTVRQVVPETFSLPSAAGR